jgi:fatty-acyl-CoA synthase
MTLPHSCLTARNDNAPRDITVGDVLIEWARRTPSRIAVADVAPHGPPHGAPPRSWTCEALRDDAATLAVALLSRYEPGARIALWAPTCPEAVVLQFAAAFAGLVVVTIDPTLPAADMAEIVERSGSAGLFVMSDRHGRRLSRAAAKAPRSLREIVDLADRRSLFAKTRSVDGLPQVRPGDPAEIRYPAGRATTGEAILHRDLADALRGAHDVAAPPVSHAMAVA